MIKNLLFIFIALALLSSCFKEDDPLPPFAMQTTTIELGQYYLHQVYFNLGSNEKVSSNERNDWDIGFECGDSSFHIILNTSTFSLAANSGEKEFEQVTDTLGFDWKFDKSDGNSDSTAIGNWFQINDNDTVYSNHVYVINRGYDHLGNIRGLRKIMFTHVDSASYSFNFSDFDGGNYSEHKVLKREDVKYTYFSFRDGGSQVDFEPGYDSWDLLFTQYTTLLYTDDGLPYPYLVTGVLSNYNVIEMSMDTLSEYAKIDRNYAENLNFTTKRDFIGYDWKELIGDVNSGNVYYEIVEDRNYVLRTSQGLYFKLRFISFYNEEGEKGFPTIQYDVL